MEASIIEAYIQRKKLLREQSKSMNKEMKSRNKSTSTILVERWWEKPPTIAGECCSDAQLRLSHVNSYTGIQRKRPDDADADAIAGDFCYKPKRATRILTSAPVDEVANVNRTGDFRTEVEWRLQLRPQFN